MSAPVRPAWADEETLRVVRPEVRSILESSAAFQKLPDTEKRSLAGTMVKVASYMANPDGLAAKELSEQGGLLRKDGAAAPARARAAGRAPLARGQEEENATERLRGRIAEDPGFAGEDFKAGAVKQGVEQFGALVKKVDFPKFVSGLIQNVFQAIVDSSLQQMKAYGELLANVAKTVDQFAQDNITANNSRDWLAQKFPDKLGIDTSATSSGFSEGEAPPQPQPHVTVREGVDETEALRAVSEELQLAQPVTDLSDEAQESRLVTAARLHIARMRQQLLSSMVILGINRIVVTDGLIHAKVVFDMRASDVARRASRASMYDSAQEKASVEASAEYGSWFSPVSASMKTSASSEHVATVESSVEDTSESKAEVKAKLTGEVRVNFKSDYFPMEKLASPQMIAAIQGNAQPVERPAAGAAGAAAPAG
jgi:hypothetical protein